MTLRKTNTYEERSIGLGEGDDSATGTASHLQKQLVCDIWFQFLAFFLVSVLERGHGLREDPGFNPFLVLFEVTSACGTVRLSTDVPGEYYNLSGSFASLSKASCDAVCYGARSTSWSATGSERSILLPGEALMQRLDAEYRGQGRTSVEGFQRLITNLEEGRAQTEGSEPAPGQQDSEERSIPR